MPDFNPMKQLLGYDDTMQPIIVTITSGDADTKPLHVGVRIRQWGTYFHLEPKVCWLEGTEDVVACDEMDYDFCAVRLTAAVAVADMLTNNVTKDRAFYPN